MPSVMLNGARLALGADDSCRVDVIVSDGRIGSLSVPQRSKPPATCAATQPAIDLSGYLIMPGLINGHDHLEFALFPNLGRGPFVNSTQWATSIQTEHGALIEQHRKVPNDVRLWWGAIRNLLCGATTVCHLSHSDAQLVHGRLPVRLLTRFGCAHSISDTDLESKFSSTPDDVPFFVHAGEGISEQSTNEIEQLDRMRALGGHTVIVHGALHKRAMNLVKRRGAALVWCPSSNYFLFGHTHSPAAITAAARVVLGSDSPLTASGDLLDEIHFACFHVGVEARELYEQVTSRPSQVFRLLNGEGSVVPGAVADLIAVRDLRESPATALSKLSYKDIELVLLGGRVQLASDAVRMRLPDSLAEGLQPLQIEKMRRWVRAPLARLFEETEKILGPGLSLGGKRIWKGAATNSNFQSTKAPVQVEKCEHRLSI